MFRACMGSTGYALPMACLTESSSHLPERKVVLSPGKDAKLHRDW